MLQQQVLENRRSTLIALIGLVVLAGLFVKWEPGTARSNPVVQPTGSDHGDSQEVLARLPAANRNPQLRLAARGSLVRSPLETMVLAARNLETLRRDGDSQIGGFTETLLLGEAVKTEPRAMLLLADLYQFQHRFDESEQLLSRLRRSGQGGSQTWLLSANLARVQGRLDDANTACIKAGQPKPTLWSVLCSADLAILAGRSAAYPSSVRALAELGSQWQQDPLAAVWLADMADRAGFEAQARQHFKDALVLGIGPYGVDRYFRFLLEHHQPEAAERLLTWWLAQRSEPSLSDILNQAQIASSQGDRHRLVALEREFHRHRDSTGGQAHWRELTRFALVVEQDYAAALEHASENWRNQKEPIDAILLARAARLAGSNETSAALGEDLGRLQMFGVLGQLRQQGLL